MPRTFEEWMALEDHGDVEQLKRCWQAAIRASIKDFANATLLSDEQFEREYPIQA